QVTAASMFVERLTSSGVPDGSFNGTGEESISFSGSDIAQAQAVAIGAGGQIVLAGDINTLADGPGGSIAVAVAEVNPSGGLDASFNGSGEATLSLGPQTDAQANSVAVAPSGEVVIDGLGEASIGGSPSFLLAGFTAAGALDASFGNAGTPGYYESITGGQSADGTGVAIDQSGYIVAVGGQTDDSGNDNSLLADFTANGTLNSAFAGGGIVISDPGGSAPSAAVSVNIDPSNDIVVGGYSFEAGTGVTANVARYSNPAPTLLSTSLSVSAPTVVYGNSAALSASVTSSSTVNSGNVTFTVTDAGDDVVAILTAPVSAGAAATSISLPAGSYTISAAYADTDATFNTSAASTTLTVETAPLTISVNSMSVPYGTAVETYGVSYTGFVGSDGPTNLAGTLDFTTSANQSSSVGNYGVSVSGVSSSNYTITFEPGTLTIVQAPLTINVVNSTSVYGAALPAFGVSYSGFQNSDGPSVLIGTPAFTTSASQGSPVGNYDVSASGLTATNYAITFVDGTLSITPATLTVSVNNSTAVYGTGLPAFGVSYSPFVGSDSPASLGGTLAFTTTASAQPGVGTYSVSASGLTSSNYTISYESGSLVITAASLTVSVNNASRNYGVANPTFTSNVSGLQYSD
ncbi:MAG: MBG domain-containing protein, partial [Tepidisphaeraceae bacterium]